MKNRFFTFFLLITGLIFNTQAMDDNDTATQRAITLHEVQAALHHIHNALDEYGLTNSEQNNFMNAYPSLKTAQSTSAILLRLTLKNLSTKQAIDLMNGIYNKKTMVISLKSKK